MTAAKSTIHASAVLIGPKAALIRGPSGSGKSRLTWELIQALPFARLVADDRAYLEVHSGRLLVRPAPQLAGLIEVYGLGIRRLAFEPVATVGLVIDLAAEDATRLPDPDSGKTVIAGVGLPRLGIAPGQLALPLVLAFMMTTAGD